MTIIKRESSTEQINRLLAPFGMEIKPEKRTASGKVIDTNPIKDRAYKVTKNNKPQKVTKKTTAPKKQKPSKPKSTIFGFTFKAGGKIGSNKSKKQSGHNRLY